MSDATHVRTDLAAFARRFYQHGWMVGTSGNLSARLDDGSFWITASGRSKGELNERDFLRIAPDGAVLERGRDAQKPSDETAIHATIYRLFDTVRACFHVHTVESNLVSRLHPGDSIRLPPLEMIKGFDVWEEDPDVVLTIFENHLRTESIAREVDDRFTRQPPDVPGFLVRDHGLTAWGPTREAARNRIELFDFVFRYMVAAH